MKKSQYSWYAKNYGKDNVYVTRLRLIREQNINIKSSPQMYAYYMAAYLGINLVL
jgi:hypothetical protein